MKKNRIALGTAAIGRPVYINLKNKHSAKSLSLEAFKRNGYDMLEKAYQKGVRHFDTAPNYGFAENLLLKWLKTKNDKNITISTKWGYTYVANFDPNAVEHEVKEHSLKKLNEQWNISKNLLPQLKLYQVHSASFQSGILENSEVLKQLHKLKEKFGLVIGITSTGDNQVEVLKKALNITVANQRLFQSVQFTFNILDQSAAVLKAELAGLKGPILIKEVLANGRLIANNRFQAYQPIYSELEALAIKYGVGADAVALRFAADSFNNAIVLSGANNEPHLTANLKANLFSLTAEEMQRLRNLAISAEDYWKERNELSWN